MDIFIYYLFLCFLKLTLQRYPINILIPYIHGISFQKLNH